MVRASICALAFVLSLLSVGNSLEIAVPQLPLIESIEVPSFRAFLRQRGLNLPENSVIPSKPKKNGIELVSNPNDAADITITLARPDGLSQTNGYQWQSLAQKGSK